MFWEIMRSRASVKLLGISPETVWPVWAQRVKEDVWYVVHGFHAYRREVPIRPNNLCTCSIFIPAFVNSRYEGHIISKGSHYGP